MQARGAIYHHSQMVFHNGFVGKKYLVLLNIPGKNEPYLLLKATSQKKNKPSIPGCIVEHNVFFIPAGKTFFKLDTWVQLHERYEYSSTIPQEFAVFLLGYAIHSGRLSGVRTVVADPQQVVHIADV